jgi:type IV secretion system protein VirD4
MANKNKLRHKNSKSVLKTGLILISVIGVITFLIISYLIYSLQCYAYDNNISSDNLNLSVLIKSMPYWTNPTFTAPFDIGAIMQMHGSVWYIYVVALSLLALMLFSKNYDDYKGVEAGSADWATKRDEKENSDETGIPIGNKFYVTVNNPHGRYYEPHNLNEILIGGPGAGKTFRKIKPDIIQMYGSYVVTDPKGELYRDTAKLLIDNGYKVRVFNLINIKKTNAYNPFVYINDEQDIVVLANTFINASAGDDDKEDFWSGSAKSLLTAIMIYLWKAEGEVKCFGRVVRLLNSITYKNGRIDELCELARCLNKHSIEHPCDAATINWNGIKGTPEETMGGIAKTLSTRLDLWAVEDVNDLTVIDEMDFDNIGVEKTAIFLIVPPADTTYKAICNMFYSQLFARLMYCANFKHNGRLPLLVSIELDEFANIGRIPNFDKITAVIRSNNIRACIVLQSLPQLKALYKDNWESIIGNCSLFTYLGAPDLETRKYIVEKLDKTTVRIDTKGHSQGTTSGGSSSDNESYQGRDLLTTSELLRAFRASPKIKKKYGGYMIEFLDEYPPFWLHKFDTLSHPLIDKVGSSFPSGIPNNTDINEMYSDNEQIQKLKEVKTKMAQLMEQSVSEEKAMREQSEQKQAEQERVEQAELQRQFEEAARDAQLSEHQNVLAEIDEEELIADYEIPTIDEFIG